MKRSERYLLLERKNHVMQISKTRYRKQNKQIIMIKNSKAKGIVGAYISRNKNTKQKRNKKRRII